MTGPFHFGGSTFNPSRDAVRLTKQWGDVWRYMRPGNWRTLDQISRATGHPEASVSARLRDFRKKRFGGHTVERRYVFNGLWEYRLILNPMRPVKVQQDDDELVSAAQSAE
jgi:hypothetical protein